MSDYTPDKWVVVEITGKNHARICKVFASWYGGFAGSDSWKLNSGITQVTLQGNQYLFEGHSGSVYACHRSHYGTNAYSASVLARMTEDVEKFGHKLQVLPYDTDWLHFDYQLESR